MAQRAGEAAREKVAMASCSRWWSWCRPSRAILSPSLGELASPPLPDFAPPTAGGSMLSGGRVVRRGPALRRTSFGGSTSACGARCQLAQRAQA